jgi:hypothetical protein
VSKLRSSARLNNQATWGTYVAEITRKGSRSSLWLKAECFLWMTFPGIAKAGGILLAELSGLPHSEGVIKTLPSPGRPRFIIENEGRRLITDEDALSNGRVIG